MSELVNHGRLTADYNPTRPGSREQNQAINARREMLNVFSGAGIHEPKRRRKATRAEIRARKKQAAAKSALPNIAKLLDKVAAASA